MTEYRVIVGNRSTCFYKPGTEIPHREDGPAIIADTGTKYWYLHGELHREDGPAVIADNGTKYWYLHGEIHREGGPAIIYDNGHKEWYLNGKRHHQDGPAVIWSDGTKEWWLNGEKVTKEDVMGKSEDFGEIITLNGKRYRLIEE